MILLPLRTIRNQARANKVHFRKGLGPIRQPGQRLPPGQQGNCPNHHHNQGLGQIPPPPRMDFGNGVGTAANDGSWQPDLDAADGPLPGLPCRSGRQAFRNRGPFSPHRPINVPNEGRIIKPLSILAGQGFDFFERPA